MRRQAAPYQKRTHSALTQSNTAVDFTGTWASFVAAGLPGLRFDYDAAGMKAGTCGAGRVSGFQPGEFAVAFWYGQLVLIHQS